MSDLRGFTLIELLIALSIAATISALVVLRLDTSDARRVAQAAESLAALLEGARDEALISGRNIAVSSDGDAVQFWQMDALGYQRSEWRALPASETLRPQALKNGVRWQAQRLNDKARPLGERLLFAPDGVLEPFSIVLAGRTSRVSLDIDVMGRVRVHDLENDAAL